jgi:hypothetical protein
MRKPSAPRWARRSPADRAAKNRRVLRVVAHAGLMADRCPAFRLNTGGGEPEAITVRDIGKEHTS